MLATVGKAALGLSAVALAFVLYMVWGTSLVEGRGQQDLRSDFEALMVDAEAAAPAPSSTAEDAALPQPRSYALGEGVARIEIPSIGVDKFVVEGVGVAELRNGPGHYQNTPMPGEPGNVAIAGHRTTYGAPFGSIDELEPGSSIRVTTVEGAFDYEVAGQGIVRPEDTHVIGDYGDNRLTLTSCHPRGSARERIIVVASQVTPPTSLQTAGAEVETGAEPVLDGEDVEASLEGGAVEVVSTGFDGNDASVVPAVLWALVVVAVVVAIGVGAKFWRRWAAYLLGAPFILVALFLWFERLADVMPAGY